jgi:pimeloyl-ACP methyl ester carboxylesterase
MNRARWLMVGLGVILLLAACAPAGPTPRPTRTILPEIAASPTVDPVLPTHDPYAAHGVNLPEAAAAPNDMDIVEVAALPPEEPVEFVVGSDRLRMSGVLYRAAQEPASLILMLPGRTERKEAWLPLVTPLQQNGYTVLTVDLRGQGTTGGTVDWIAARQDVADLLDAARQISGVNAGRVAVVGADVGANLALVNCALSAYCRAVVALSPGAEYDGLVIEGAAERLGDRAALLVASTGDTDSAITVQALDGAIAGPHEVMLTAGGAHGIALLTDQPALAQAILLWLQQNL